MELYSASDPSAQKMSGMGGMDMGHSSSHSCKMSMLWNWHTIDSCFLSESWHAYTGNKFAGSLIGIIFFAIAIEAFKRIQRLFDAYVVQHSNGKTLQGPMRLFFPSGTPHVNVFQQFIRALLQMCYYGAATILMLIVMSFNGYVILFTFLGAWIGYLLFSWDKDSYGEHSSGIGCC
ncbi:copper transporter complex subunit Ctr5 [Schizosaccharomyces cryophilus OY26]|uniref:Copper transport protein n=1 Tax=Schizosaccharomyces cryophilus (strain OY26 / ATCC MYA-4695 / CBS 11777 / NBRC 106824 / NRRL Y48691) TaxID=653667 RepID=S9VZB9_SCHCR|nr:copper transporter complex subunit Ctr5 [Schizosaccharomyces cryophilus OY26]EPY52978.1 copper transporter complex subunit Ctr5 [Schizosaccharomyces cryophilus OY26]